MCIAKMVIFATKHNQTQTQVSTTLFSIHVDIELLKIINKLNIYYYCVTSLKIKHIRGFILCGNFFCKNANHSTVEI